MTPPNAKNKSILLYYSENNTGKILTFRKLTQVDWFSHTFLQNIPDGDSNFIDINRIIDRRITKTFNNFYVFAEIPSSDLSSLKQETFSSIPPYSTLPSNYCSMKPILKTTKSEADLDQSYVDMETRF